MVHNLIWLCDQTKIDISISDKELLGILSKYQLEGRYPDYVGKIYKECTKNYTNELKNKTKEIKECLLKELQKN